MRLQAHIQPDCPGPNQFTPTPRDKVWPSGEISTLDYLHFLQRITHLCVSGPALAAVAQVPESVWNKSFPAHDLYLEGEKISSLCA